MFDMFSGVLTLAFQEGAAVEKAAEVTQAVQEAAQSSHLSGGIVVAIYVAGIILSFVLGAALAKSMKVTEWGFRFGVCFAAFCTGTDALCGSSDGR
ncbi:MAG: hypothetical protein R3C49_07955 [Planctomycetaceae bacterium]